MREMTQESENKNGETEKKVKRKCGKKERKEGKR